jgi:ribose transport system substrate-binding protein
MAVKNVPNGGRSQRRRFRHVVDPIATKASRKGKTGRKKWDTVEVIGKWIRWRRKSRPTRLPQEVDAVTAQGGDTGVVQAMTTPSIRSWFGGDRERLPRFRAKSAAEGLGASAGTGPAQVAVAIDGDCALEGGAAIREAAARESRALNMKEGADILPERQLLRRKAFPTCGINSRPRKIMGQNEANK